MNPEPSTKSSKRGHSHHPNQQGILKQNNWFRVFCFISSTCSTKQVLRRLVSLMSSQLSRLHQGKATGKALLNSAVCTVETGFNEIPGKIALLAFVS